MKDESRALRCSRGFALALAVIPGLFISARATAAEFPPAPRVTTQAKLLVHDSALLIETISVFHERGLQTEVRCIRRCQRYRSRAPREIPKATLTRFVNVEWIVPKNRRIEVQVRREGANGRFLVLGVLRPLTERKLVVLHSGCLDSDGHRVSCAGPRSNEGGGGGDQNGGGHSEGAARTYEETAGGEAHTWTDYHSGGGTEGKPIQGGEAVQVTCRVRGLEVEDGNTWWYRIASNPWANGFYVSADPFYNNGQTSGPLTQTPFVDERVPEC